MLIKVKKEENGIDVDGRCGGIFGMVFGGFAFLSFWLLDAYLIMLPVLVCPFF